MGTLMTGSDIVHVAIAPPDILEADLVERVSAIVNKDLYGTRLVLTGKIPRLVAHCQTTQEAESIAQRLRTLGVVAMVCNDSELRKPSSTRFRAQALKLGEGEVVFWDRGQQARVVEAKSAFLILKGMWQTSIERETTRTRRRLNLPVTLLTGGIPISRRVEETAKDVSIDTEYFVRLYDRTSWEPGVEIFQRHFDYASLGTEMAPVSLTNLNIIVTKLRDTFPEAIFDDRLSAHLGMNMPSAAPGDEIEINCKLIYLYHQSVSCPGPPA